MRRQCASETPQYRCGSAENAVTPEIERQIGKVGRGRGFQCDSSVRDPSVKALVRPPVGLGLARDDVVAETTRSVKQVELRANARGLKVP
jgi:hypothetical protein